MGFRTGGVTCWEEEYPAMAMCNAVFGGTTLSTLFMNVREKLSLCYYASSTLEKMKGLILVLSLIHILTCWRAPTSGPDCWGRWSSQTDFPIRCVPTTPA